MNSNQNETVVVLLREAAAVSSSVKEIAERTGWSLPTVRKRLKEHGVESPDGRSVAKQPPRKWTSDKQKFLEEHAATMGLSELAKALEVNVSTVRIKARESGVQYQRKGGQGAPRRVWTSERLDWLQEELRTKPVSQIVAESGISRGSITGAVDDYGLKRLSQAEANKSEWRTGRISETVQKKTFEKYPPEGPWECFQCKEEKPVSEFPEKTTEGHVCYRCLRLSRIERTYGITRQQYLELYEAQDGKCAICFREEWRTHPRTGRVYDLSVDHDHTCCPGKKSCGKCVRGLLCARCNNMLGHVEAEGVLQGMLNYLN